MLKKKDQVGIVGCSNPQALVNRENIEELVRVLEEMGLSVWQSPCLYGKKESLIASINSDMTNKVIDEEDYTYGCYLAQPKASALMACYENPEIKAIFDVSGGDLANEVISHLDFEVIGKNPKPFWGYSDLTTMLNAIYTKTGQKAYLYQIRNLIYKEKEEQRIRFKDFIFEEQKELMAIDFKFIQGEKMSGTLVGGNIRCLLKLAGTPFMPDFRGKLLFLESYGGKPWQMITYLNQLKQMKVFDEVSGILLGTFTQMEANDCKPSISELVQSIVANEDLPIAKTNEVGHSSNSKALVIGEKLEIGTTL